MYIYVLSETSMFVQEKGERDVWEIEISKK